MTKNKNINGKYGERLAALRKEKRYTQQKLARLMDVDRTTIARWESGDINLTIKRVREICKIFRISEKYFYTGLDDNTPEDEDVAEVLLALNMMNRRGKAIAKDVVVTLKNHYSI